MKILLGYKRFTSKKGQDYCVALISRPLTEREQQRGSVGLAVEEIFLPDEQKNYLTPDHLNKPVDIDYDIVGGRPVVVSFSVQKGGK